MRDLLDAARTHFKDPEPAMAEVVQILTLEDEELTDLNPPTPAPRTPGTDRAT